jgi:hypothetical protein
LLLIYVLMVALAVWSWRKGANVVADFGRELYTPWQLASGKVLYRDVASIFGPLSQYLNALVFRFAGVSVSSLLVANLLWIAITTALVYDFFKRSTDTLAAILVAAVFLCPFAFGHLDFFGNFNYLTPYAHEATHGVFLSIAAIWSLTRFVSSRKHWLAGLSGFCLGLTFLTKPEISLAALAATVAGWVLATRIERFPGPDARRTLLVSVLCFALAALLPAVAFVTYFATHMTLSDAAWFTLSAWTSLSAAVVTSSTYYLESSGLDRPGLNSVLMVLSAIAALVFVALVAAVDRWTTESGGRTVIACGSIALVLLLVFANRPLIVFHFARGYPLLVLMACLLLGRGMVAIQEDPALAARRLYLAVWSVFALMLLGKISLYSRLQHYGFYMAMPATLLLIAIGVHVLPAQLQRRWRGGLVMRWSMAATAVILMVASFLWSNIAYARKTYQIGDGEDMLLTWNPGFREWGATVNGAIQEIDDLAPPEATLAVLPEGASLNYWTRRPNSIPYINLMPPELTAFGEARVLEALRSQSPDYVVLLHKDMREYGVPLFGESLQYGSRIVEWVRANYVLVRSVGGEARGEGELRIEILQKGGGPAD